MKLKSTPLLIATLVAMTLSFEGPRTTIAEDSSQSEYDSKAGSLYNFTKFVEWPQESFSGPESPFIIGIAGQDPFNGALNRMVKDKRYRSHKMEVQRVAAPAEFQKCHVLFISRSEGKKVSDILKTVKRSSVLTVGETDHFLQSGGMINFVTESNRVRFEINYDAARNAQLNVSSKLLGLASRVINPAQ
jgi:hypothetical protein